METSNVVDIYPLSPMQKGMLFHALYDGVHQQYFEQFTCDLNGPMRLTLLEDSWRQAVEHHDILRTVFVWEGVDEPLQVTLAEASPAVTYIDMRALPVHERDARLRAFLDADLARPFELSEAPPHRFALIQIADDCCKLVFSFHHMLLDGLSMCTLLGRVLDAYEARCAGATPSMPESRPYRDFIARTSRRQDDGEQYWRKRLAGFDSPNRIDGHRRPSGNTATGRAERSLALSVEQTRALQKFARDNQLTPSILLQAAWALLVGSYSHRRDVVFGVTLSNRPPDLDGVENMIGLFINTLPLRVLLDERRTVVSWLTDIRSAMAALWDYDHCDLGQVHRWSQIDGGQQLFDSLVVFENYGIDEALGQRERIAIANIDVHERTNYSLTLIGMPGEQLTLRLLYDDARFDSDTVGHMLEHLVRVLAGLVAEPSALLGTITYVSEAERQVLVTDWNSTDVAYPDRCLHELFEEQVQKQPQAPAVIEGDSILTYEQLERRANRVAYALIDAGLTLEDRVAICAQRSTQFIVGVLGILKAGAAYVPVDPGYPEQRVDFMVRDSGCRAVLTMAPFHERFSEFSGLILSLDADLLHDEGVPSVGPPRVHCYPRSLANIMYTSGSTGQPKGVLIDHECVVSRMWQNSFAPMGPTERIAHISNVSFDAATLEIWNPLTQGGSLVVVPNDVVLSPSELAVLIERHGIRQMFMTSALFHRIADAQPDTFCSLDRFLVGGGVVDPARAARVLDARAPVQLVDAYGPTECTVFASSFDIERSETSGVRIPIGGPVSNARLYVLDARLEPVPVGIPGQLYIAGPGVSRGYQGRPGLTAERFMPDPFGGVGARMYRTGDLATWRADGVIDFLGRRDRQIKLRGFRIELGEIEQSLARYPGVRGVLVVAHGDEQSRQLVAYVVGGDTVRAADIEVFAQQHLPEFMVPTWIIRLATLPVTANGKIDYAALPVPDREQPARGAPRSLREGTLTRIWAKVLGVEEIGIHDDFFARGGDSIMSLVIAARAREAGVYVTPRDIFRFPTIATLSSALDADEKRPLVDDTGIGPVDLTPVQRWFFELSLPDPHRFVQTFLFKLGRAVKLDTLAHALGVVAAHHDALRLRFRRADDGQWWQECIASDAVPDRLDVAVEEVDDIATGARQCAAKLAAQLNLGDGPLVQAASLGAGGEQHLLLVIHHLVVDVVSWRILLTDLARACEALERGEAVRLPARSTSFKRWSENLGMVSRSSEILTERDYWLRQVELASELPSDHPDGVNTLVSRRFVDVELGADATQALVTRANRTYETHALDLLLAALARTIGRWSERNAVTVMLERHGREDLGGGEDLSRTVGWMTTLAPFALHRSEDGDHAADIRDARARRRAVPRAGLGYGLLRYLRGDADIAQQLARPVSLSFNYLGRTDPILANEPLFAPVDEFAEGPIASGGKYPFQFDVVSQIRDGALRIRWYFSENLHEHATVVRLATGYVDDIRVMIDHCVSQQTPTAEWLDDKRIASLVGDPDNLADSYPLTPLQQGLLFHSRYRRDSLLYVEQHCTRIRGALDVQRLRAAWRTVIDRHDVLRTVFVIDGPEQLMQVVHRRFEPPWLEQDLRDCSPEQRDAAIAEVLDAEKRALDPTQAPPIRFCVLHLEDDYHLFSWTFHHVLLDGWSLALVLEQVFAAYRQLGRGEALQVVATRPYRNFIDWLTLRTGNSEPFWRAHLAGFETRTRLARGDTTRAEVRPQAFERKLDASTTKALDVFCRGQRITQSTLMQAAFALLLGRYTLTDDVLFGITLSGRSYQVEGIDSMVGLFINTLPMRLTWQRDTTVAAWLARTQGLGLALQQHEQDSLVDIQRWSGLGGSLFDALLVFENYPLDRSSLRLTDDLEVEPFTTSEHLDYPLIVAVIPGDELVFHVIYASDIFGQSFVRDLLDHYCQLITAMIDAPDARLSTLPMLLPAQRTRLLDEWNQTAADYSRDSSIVARFAAQAQAHPAAVAVVDGDLTLTYQQLVGQAYHLAGRLRALGVVRGQRVAICLDRSAAFIAVALGILEVGAAYVPLDPAYPDERLHYMLKDSGCQLLFGGAQQIERFAAIECRALSTADELDWDAAPSEYRPLDESLCGDDLAYIIYTSGSTGAPKGVAVPHRGVMRIACNNGFTPLDQNDAIAHLSNVSFDAATWEIWGALLNGGRVVVFDRFTALSSELPKKLVEHRVSAMFMTTALVNQFADEVPDAFSSLTHMLFGGELVDQARIQRVLERGAPGRLLHVYGPTECVTFSSWYHVARVEVGDATVPIGRPVNNLRFYVLDPDLEPMPVSTVGELYIGGDGIAVGYHGRPALTAASWLPDPYAAQSGARMYRTGDVVRYDAAGNLEFVGREDNQIKLRGFRIELGEIVSVMRAHPQVDDAVVTLQGEGRDKRLIAHIGAATRLDERTLRAYLNERLPDYMVPAVLIVMRQLPVAAGGKIDRAALPEAAAMSVGSGGRSATARNAHEETLVGIWKDVLELATVGVHDNFFDLGGHSLLATRVVARIESIFQIEMAIRTLFIAPTIAQLATHIEAARGVEHAIHRTPIVQVSRDDELPLSFAQERLWFISRMGESASRAYHIVTAHRLEGPLNEGALVASLDEIVRRHECLRTLFPAVGGRPFQLIAPKEPFALERVDLRAMPADERERELTRVSAGAARRPFDLGDGPLFTGLLVRLGDDEHALLLVMHHIVADGWGLDVLYRELAVLYDAFSQSQPSPLPELEIQYADFAVWQRRRLQGEYLDRMLSYWMEHLGPQPPVLELPTDFPRPKNYTFSGGHVSFDIPESIAAPLRTLARSRAVTDFMLYLAVFKILLYRYTGQRDIAVGTPIANRSHVAAEPLIGFFVNTLVLRSHISSDTSFLDFLDSIKSTTLGGYDHQDMPFERLVEELQPVRDLSRPALCQVMFVLQRSTELALADLSVRALDIPFETAKMDMTLELLMGAEGNLTGRLEYNSDLFERTTVERAAGHFVYLLGSIAENSAVMLVNLALTSPQEHSRRWAEWNDTDALYPRDKSLPALFAQQVQAHPEAVAIVDETHRLTYAQLDELARNLCRKLTQLGIRRGDSIAVLMPRSSDFIVALLGILRAGGAYVPVDPSYPEERVRYMLQDSGARVLLTTRDSTSGLDDIDCTFLFMEDASASHPSDEDVDEPGLDLGGDDLAYVIYTSGSTGRPKGVMVEHLAITRLCLSGGFATLGPDDAVAHLSNVSFDAATWEIWGALLCGARIVIFERDTVLSPEFADHLREHKVSAVFVTTALFNQIVSERSDAFAGVQNVLFGGEAVDPEYVRGLVRGQPPERLLHVYGPTECVTFSTWQRVRTVADDAATVPIGRPLGNMTCYVLDRDCNPVPVGMAGELYIGSHGLARGYHARRQLTAERFVPDPFTREPGRRMYRTGDVVRRLADGSLVYVGRIDDQVKIRGHRIEPSEIAGILREHPAVDEVAVLLGKRHGEKHLIAYVGAPTQPEGRVLRDYLRSRLPGYMMPSGVVVLAHLPISPSGKLDRKALTESEVEAQTDSTTVAQTPLEEMLVRIWAEVLKLDQIGIHDNFFEIGGNSLIATQVVSRVRKELEKDIKLRTLFEAPTIAEYARLLADLPDSIPNSGGDRSATPIAKLPRKPIRRD